MIANIRFFIVTSEVSMYSVYQNLLDFQM